MPSPGHFAIDILDRNRAFMDRILDDLSLEDLHALPAPESNPVGWLLWHISRALDNRTALVQGSNQLWITEGWYEAFGRQPDPADRGGGQTIAEVQSFRIPSIESVTGYYAVVHDASCQLYESLNIDDLDRATTPAGAGRNMTVLEAVNAALVHTIHHTGQMAYAKGLLRGIGWLGF